jgi:hypothetical protein
MMFKYVRQVLLAVITAALPAMALAQAYGQGAYDTLTYSNGVFQIGGITLPNTGAFWIGVVSVAVAALVTAVWVYRRTIKQEKAEQSIH